MTVIYYDATRQPELTEIARRYGEVWADPQPAPKLPLGAQDVTGKSVLGVILAWAVGILFLALLFLAVWFGKP